MDIREQLILDIYSISAEEGFDYQKVADKILENYYVIPKVEFQSLISQREKEAIKQRTDDILKTYRKVWGDLAETNTLRGIIKELAEIGEKK